MVVFSDIRHKMVLLNRSLRETLFMNNQQNQPLAKIFSGGRRFIYKKNEIIIRGDDTPQGIYLIEEGFVKVYSITKRGDENIRIILKPGEFFPVIWAFTDISKDIFYESFGGCSLKRISRDSFLELTKSTSLTTQTMIDSLVHLFSMYSERIDNLEYSSAYERVVCRVAQLARHFGVKEEDGIVIAAPINHNEIAASVNIARETASRAMARLERKGLIAYKNRKVIVKNIATLEKELSS